MPSYWRTRRCRKREPRHEGSLHPLRGAAGGRIHGAYGLLAAGARDPSLSLSVRELLPALSARRGDGWPQGFLQPEQLSDLLPEPDPYPRLLRDDPLQQPGHDPLLL